MRTAMIHGIEDVRVHLSERPVAQPGEVMVRVQAVGVCGSDVHYYQEGGIGDARIEESMTPGHEFAGEVVGDSGAEFGFEEGTIVAVDPAQACLTCEMCVAGYQNLCLHMRFLGTPAVAGGLRDYIAVPHQNLVKLPAGFDATRGAMLEPLGVALHGVDLSRIKPMSGVAVLGAGPIGLLTAQVARAMGAARVRIVEPHEGRRAAARRLGFSLVHPTWEEAFADTGGRGEDFVIEATNSPKAPEHAVHMAAAGGKITLIGIPEGDIFILSSGNARRKGLTIKFARRMGNVYPRAIQLVAQGRVDVDSLITHRFTLDRTEEAFQAASRLEKDFVKAVIYPGED